MEWVWFCLSLAENYQGEEKTDSDVSYEPCKVEEISLYYKH